VARLNSAVSAILSFPDPAFLVLSSPNRCPLAETLRNKADLFTFNRLSMVGEGAKLQVPSKERYAAFLQEYIQASKSNPTIALKDNLINILLRAEGEDLFDGCADYGCGAAFNFISLLPDGEAHACRKFPSPIGNVLEVGIAEAYDSEAAKRYRSGSAACRQCTIRIKEIFHHPDPKDNKFARPEAAERGYWSMGSAWHMGPTKKCEFW
jgi:hypothetical protein